MSVSRNTTDTVLDSRASFPPSMLLSDSVDSVVTSPPAPVALSPERERAIRVIKVLLFSASIIPAMVTGAIAFHQGYFDALAFALVALGLFIGQAGGDYLYYYGTNFHTDQRDAHTKIFAGWRPFFADRLFKDEKTLLAGILCLAIDALIGAYFVFKIGYGILLFALLGGLVAIFFTPLMLRGYKEVVIFITFGPLSMMGAYYALNPTADMTTLAMSIPIACFVTVVAYLKGARYEIRQEAGNTFVIKLNNTVIKSLLIAGYASLILGVVFHVLPALTLLGLLSIPFAISVVRTVEANRSEVHEYLWATVRSIAVLISFGVLVSIGLIFS
jgi:1,4-dihydroxy-2-naphthoate octaprenyltransferase